MRPSLALSVLVLFAVACSSKPVETSARGKALPVDHPAMDNAKLSSSAQTQRLSLAQLRGALPVVMGKDAAGNPITWMTPGGKPGLDAYSITLGEADYVNSTEDDLSPGPLYLKFMNDAARDVCDRALIADQGRQSAGDRVLLHAVSFSDTTATNATGVAANLRYLKLRFHGVKVADTDDTPIAGLQTLFTQVVAATPVAKVPVKEGWRAVCVALLTSPEFHLY